MSAQRGHLPSSWIAVLGAALCAAGSTALPGCDGEPAPPHVEEAVRPHVAFEARFLELLQRVDPLPTGDAREVVLAVRGVPIRRGDFDRIVDFWRTTLAPDHALKTLREKALVNELLPRALALSTLPAGDLEAIARALDAHRRSDGRYDLAALTAALAPWSEAPGNSEEIFELMIERMRNAMPLVAAAGIRLAQPGDQVGPIVTRDGVFVYERTTSAGTPAPPPPGEVASLEPARWVRTAALIWRLRAADTPAETYLPVQEAKEHLNRLRDTAIRGGEIQVLDPTYAEAIPR